MTEEEKRLRATNKVQFYQNVLFHKLADVIVSNKYNISKACKHFGESWTRVRQYLSAQQKIDITDLANKHGIYGGKKLKKIK